MSERKKFTPAKFQFIVYTLGVIFVAVSFVNLINAQAAQQNIVVLEQNVTYMESLRGDLRKLQDDFTLYMTKMFTADIEANNSVELGIMTPAEANMSIEIFQYEYEEGFEIFKQRLIVRYTDKDILNIFTEHIIRFSWFGEERSDFVDAYENAFEDFGVTDANSWEIINWPKADWTFFIYNPTYDLMKEGLGYMPFLIMVDWVAFDEYVAVSYTTPLQEAEANLILTQRIAIAITIGILALGFLVDFTNTAPFWKFVYVILAILAIVFSIMSMVNLINEGGTLLSGGGAT